MEHFKKLNVISVKEHTKSKRVGGTNLTYLSWTWAWGELKKVYPNAIYEVKKFDNKPFMYDKNTGYMVFTEITIEEIAHEMWLPVMDGANKAMKSEPYTYKTKYDEKSVVSASMFDINKTIMRCLVKNIAMFGLGLYIYAGEDLPEPEDKKGMDVAQITGAASSYARKYALNGLFAIDDTKDDDNTNTHGKKESFNVMEGTEDLKRTQEEKQGDKQRIIDHNDKVFNDLKESLMDCKSEQELEDVLVFNDLIMTKFKNAKTPLNKERYTELERIRNTLFEQQ